MRFRTWELLRFKWDFGLWVNAVMSWDFGGPWDRVMSFAHGVEVYLWGPEDRNYSTIWFHYMTFWKRKTTWIEKRSEVVSLKENKGTTLGYKRIWGVLELLYILLVVVAAWLYTFVKIQNWTVRRVSNIDVNCTSIIPKSSKKVMLLDPVTSPLGINFKNTGNMDKDFKYSTILFIKTRNLRDGRLHKLWYVHTVE